MSKEIFFDASKDLQTPFKRMPFDKRSYMIGLASNLVHFETRVTQFEDRHGVITQIMIRNPHLLALKPILDEIIAPYEFEKISCDHDRFDTYKNTIGQRLIIAAAHSGYIFWTAISPYLLLSQEYKDKVADLLYEKADRASWQEPPFEKYDGWVESAQELIADIEVAAETKFKDFDSTQFNDLKEVNILALCAGLIDGGSGIIRCNKQVGKGRSEIYNSRIILTSYSVNMLEMIRNQLPGIVGYEKPTGSIGRISSKGTKYSLSLTGATAWEVIQAVGVYSMFEKTPDILYSLYELIEGKNFPGKTDRGTNAKLPEEELKRRQEIYTKIQHLISQRFRRRGS